LVTVGRFRQFVNAWNGGAGYTPQAGSGKHTHLNGGLGLANGETPGTYESGWIASDDGNIALTNANLGCGTETENPETWTAAAGKNETLPITCANWYESYAFCIWDGGFLPSEAEWEYAAAGGDQQRDYPWGAKDPGTNNQYAIYGANYDNDSIAPVGTPTLGAGRWGQLDLAGEVWEWNLDWYAGSYASPCADCAYVTTASYRVSRGSAFYENAMYLLPSIREAASPSSRISYDGFRCARAP
jgi:formylglycine-generating enzyme required for sulfatase activity